MLKYFEEVNELKNKREIDALIFRQAEELRHLIVSSVAIDSYKEKNYFN